MKSLALLILIISSASATSSPDLICLCEIPRAKNEAELVKRERKDSSAVFSGKVISITEKDHYIVEVTFKVENSWKNISSDEVTVITSPPAQLKINRGSCGFPFQLGERYLVYTHRTQRSKLETTICTRTRKLSEAKNDLEVLGKGKRTKPNNSFNASGISSIFIRMVGCFS